MHAQTDPDFICRELLVRQGHREGKGSTVLASVPNIPCPCGSKHNGYFAENTLLWYCSVRKEYQQKQA